MSLNAKPGVGGPCRILADIGNEVAIFRSVQYLVSFCTVDSFSLPSTSLQPLTGFSKRDQE